MRSAPPGRAWRNWKPGFDRRLQSRLDLGAWPEVELVEGVVVGGYGRVSEGTSLGRGLAEA